jgi:succinoglycan biosynthesis protein ExoL
MTLLFLLPVETQARFRRRIEGLLAAGAEARAASFERDYLPGKPLPCPLRRLGRVDHGSYWRRAWIYLRALQPIRNLSSDVTAIHAFGLDLLLLAWLATLGTRRPHLVYELGDVRRAMTRKEPVGAGLRWLERFLCRRCKVVVVTSDRYTVEYLLPTHGLDPAFCLTIENKLPAGMPIAPKPLPDDVDRPLRIGYFGLLRCRRSWETLCRILTLADGHIEVQVRGQPAGDGPSEAEIAAENGAHYGGPYVAPDDLPEIYGDVDVVWVAHHHGVNNLRWARANRFYEACAFQRAMIGQVGTVDGNVIAAENWGLVIDLRDTEAAARSVVGVERSRWRAWSARLAAAPRTVYQHTDEHARLLTMIGDRSA